MANKTNETDYSAKITHFKENIKSEAEELVLKTFPRKTLELHSLLESPEFSLKNLEKIKQEINIPIPEFPYVTPVQPKTVSVNHVEEDALLLNDNSASNGPSKKRKYLVLAEGDDVNEQDKEEEESGGDGGLKKTRFNLKNIASNSIDTGSRVLILPSGIVSTNKSISNLIQAIKPRILRLVEDCNLLKMWVLFLIPRIEDGNNFGVSIQEETLTEIRTVEAEAAAYFDQMSRYFLSRAKIITKIAKYPHVEDFRRNVAEIDEKEFISLRLIVAELRNHYASLHDIVTKNLEKIKTPRPQNQNTMY